MAASTGRSRPAAARAAPPVAIRTCSPAPAPTQSAQIRCSSLPLRRTRRKGSPTSRGDFFVAQRFPSTVPNNNDSHLPQFPLQRHQPPVQPEGRGFPILPVFQPVPRYAHPRPRQQGGQHLRLRLVPGRAGRQTPHFRHAQAAEPETAAPPLERHRTIIPLSPFLNPHALDSS